MTPTQLIQAISMAEMAIRLTTSMGVSWKELSELRAARIAEGRDGLTDADVAAFASRADAARGRLPSKTEGDEQ